jgi:hypothetical protein
MKRHLALAMLVAWGICAAQASAQWGDSLVAYADSRVPYFALHPPVYYSQPVPRAYGYSPFPYPPEMITPNPQFRSAAPSVIHNPYATAAWQTGSTPGTSIPSPLRIKNPYVTLADDAPPPPPAPHPR